MNLYLTTQTTLVHPVPKNRKSVLVKTKLHPEEGVDVAFYVSSVKYST